MVAKLHHIKIIKYPFGFYMFINSLFLMVVKFHNIKINNYNIIFFIYRILRTIGRWGR